MTIHELPHRVINKMHRVISEPILDNEAKKCLRKLNENRVRKNKIDVLFIVQMPELWDKQKRVFELMKENKYFNPRLFIVPKFDFINDRIGNYGEELTFFLSFDLNALRIDDVRDFDSFICDYDYVFYQRQYNRYLPVDMTNENVIKYSKTCYIPYATPEIKKTGLYGKDFYRNIYLGFMESEYARDVMNSKFKGNVGKGIQKYVYVGYPPFENMMAHRSECLYRRILWTPRWSYDPYQGGSHFFEYSKHINDYAQTHSGLEVCIRPHPMMFDNFLKEKRMTEEDVSIYLQDVHNSGAHIDTNKDIGDTFQTTDILISDRSSVIPMFFMTGKPIIYCPIESEYGYLFQTILPGLYIANTWEEMKGILNDLTNGNDRLKEVRDVIIQKRFSSNMNASQKIVDVIYKDYYEDN